jgi:hypothetical protein
MNFIEALDQEIKALRQSLETDARFLKVKELERLRTTLYMANGSHVPAVPLRAEVTVRAPGRETSPARKAAIEAAIAFLKNKTEPVKTTEILKHFMAIGIKLGGTDPQNNLSALLHYSEHFVSHGRVGWTLKKNKGPPALASEPL